VKIPHILQSSILPSVAEFLFLPHAMIEMSRLYIFVCCSVYVKHFWNPCVLLSQHLECKVYWSSSSCPQKM